MVSPGVVESIACTTNHKINLSAESGDEGCLLPNQNSMSRAHIMGEN